jgi:uncharacterized protein YqeY
VAYILAIIQRIDREIIMSIEQRLNTRLKEAMRNKKDKELSALRMVKTLAQTQKAAAGFNGETGDAFWLETIARYVKQQKKAIKEYQKAGDKGAENIAQIQYEIDYFAPFLPKMLGEDEVRVLVKSAIAETGAVGSNMAGKIVGFIMKSNKGKVDAAMVKEIATKELG